MAAACEERDGTGRCLTCDAGPSEPCRHGSLAFDKLDRGGDLRKDVPAAPRRDVDGMPT